MLDRMDLAFQGSPHCGLDDSINIARVVNRLLNDGCEFRVNEKICEPVDNHRWLSTMAPVNKEEAMHWLQKCKNFNLESESDSDENGTNEDENSTNEDTHSESSDDSQDDQNDNEDIEEICGDNFAKQCDIKTSDTR